MYKPANFLTLIRGVETAGARLKFARNLRQVDQAALADGVGCSQGAISQILTGSTQRSRYLPDIADFLHVSLRWLRLETDDIDEGLSKAVSPIAAAEALDLVPVASIDASYGLGGTFLGPDIDEKVLHFPRIFIESITASPFAFLTWARGRGDSMFPTIGDGDLVLIDRSNQTPREQDALWALTVGELAMIKRLRIRGAKVTILSDNDRVPPDEAHVDEVNIVGRVVFAGRRV